MPTLNHKHSHTHRPQNHIPQTIQHTQGASQQRQTLNISFAMPQSPPSSSISFLFLVLACCCYSCSHAFLPAASVKKKSAASSPPPPLHESSSSSNTHVIEHIIGKRRRISTTTTRIDEEEVVGVPTWSPPPPPPVQTNHKKFSYSSNADDERRMPLNVFSTVLHTSADQEFGQDDALFHEALNFQWSLLKANPTEPAPFLLCSPYAKGREMATLLRADLPAGGFHTVHSSRSSDAMCFLMHAPYGELTCLNREMRGV